MNYKHSESMQNDEEKLNYELKAEIDVAEREHQQQIAMAKEMLADDPDAKDDANRMLTALEDEGWIKNYVLGNFQRNLPIERDKWQVAGESIPLDAKISDLYPEQQEGGPNVTERFKNQTWRAFYTDIDNALHYSCFNDEEIEKLSDAKFRRENAERLYKAYTALRAQGYSHYDLTR